MEEEGLNALSEIERCQEELSRAEEELRQAQEELRSAEKEVEGEIAEIDQRLQVLAGKREEAKARRGPRPVVLKVEGLNALDDIGRHRIKDVSFEVLEGEIFGMYFWISE